MQDWWAIVEDIKSNGEVPLTSCGTSSTAQYYKRRVNKYLEDNKCDWRVVVKIDKKKRMFLLVKA